MSLHSLMEFEEKCSEILPLCPLHDGLLQFYEMLGLNPSRVGTA